MIPKCELKSATLFIKDDVSGEFMEMGNINKLELEEVYVERETYADGIKYVSQSREVTLSYNLKKISRKKFVKLLMARKIQRNLANELAKYYLNKRGYYSYIDLFLLDGGTL